MRIQPDLGGESCIFRPTISVYSMGSSYLPSGSLKARQPASLVVGALLDKRVRRIVDVTLGYVGGEVPDDYLGRSVFAFHRNSGNLGKPARDTFTGKKGI